MVEGGFFGGCYSADGVSDDVDVGVSGGDDPFSGVFEEASSSIDFTVDDSVEVSLEEGDASLLNCEDRVVLG